MTVLRALLPAAVLLACLAVSVPGHAEEAVRVRWDAGLDALGRQAAELSPRVRAQAERQLGWTYEGSPVDLVLVRGHERARQVVGARVPEWAVGVATASPPRILIRVDLLERGWGSGLEQVLRHEWVHILWRSHAGPRHGTLPLWFEEGLAEEIGGGISVDAGAALDVAAAFGRLLAFSDLTVRFPREAASADLAYKQSRSWVAHLARERGWDPIRGVLDDVATGVAEAERRGRDAFAETIRRRTGLSLGEWHAAWQFELEREARPWFHLLFKDVSWLLLMGLSLVGAVAFFGLVRRRRRQIARLPDDGP